MMLKLIDRYVQTMRHLRAEQIYGRVRFRLAHPSPDSSPPPPVRKPVAAWVAPAPRPASLMGKAAFRFLEEDGSLEKDGWDNPQRSKLWRYNQHYFDDLSAAGAAGRREWQQALIADWIAANPPAQGTGWEPYPLSLRIVNWIKFALAGQVLSDAARASLAVQARFLCRRIEWHLLGNHLFANAKALLFAGFFFAGPEAESWRRRAAAIFERELPEQFLADGGQFELSPMYHALALEDLLDIANLGGAFAVGSETRIGRLLPTIDSRIGPAKRWLAAMTHPDGEIAFFNDAALGVAPRPSELFAYAERLGWAREGPTELFTWLEASGYFRWQEGPAVLIGDMAAVGPDYLPGHAHADTLSFEMSLGDQRLFVNSGVSEYGAGPERQRQRGTAAHNTVVVAGRNSSDVWAGFRVARRARVRGMTTHRGENGLCVRAEHDGYARLSGRPVHRREWQMAVGQVTIVDRITARTDAVARFHLHPTIAVEQKDERSAGLRLPDGTTVKCVARGGPMRVEHATWHSRFGCSEPSKCLQLKLLDGESELSIHWA